MKTARFAPALRYQLRDFVLGLAPFYAVMVLLVAASLIAARYLGGEVSFSGFGVAAAICMLVYGIVAPRPNLRLCIQMGVSRRTAFLTLLLAAVLACGILAAAGELLLAAGQALDGGDTGFVLTDLYQMIYVDGGMEGSDLPFGQHLLGMVFNLSSMAALFALGLFLTLLFWRLNKFWTVAAAIAIPVVINGAPLLLWRLGLRFPAVAAALAALGQALGRSVWNLVLLLSLAAAVLALLSWLLVRRANIRAPQG